MQVGPGSIIGGKYQVERPLARGGMGSVWVARHVSLGSEVAIKLLDQQLATTPLNTTRFEREARAAANLRTPHVVLVHDYGVEDGTAYIAMELLHGENLNMRLRRRRRLTLLEAGQILSQMGRGLRRAHEAGIVHRDLKPANVFLAQVDEEEVVKILDFGIAKETWSRVEESTKTGEIFGSPHYMSPEQARAQKSVDHRADIWATGVMAYRMITGKLPFPGEVLGEVLSCVLVDPFPPMADVAPDLPPQLDGFFAKALAKKKEERFSSIGELVEAFSAIVSSASAGDMRLSMTSESMGNLALPTQHSLYVAAGSAVPVSAPENSGAPAPRPPPASTAENAPSAASRAVPPVPPARPLPPAQPVAANRADEPSKLADNTITTPFQLPEHSPLASVTPPSGAPSQGDATGPSIANASNSLPPRKAVSHGPRTVVLTLGLAACLAAAASWVLFSRGSSRTNASAEPAVTRPADTDIVPSTAPLPVFEPTTAPSVEPTAPAATANSAEPDPFATAAPTPPKSAAPEAPAAATKPPAPDKTAAPAKTATPVSTAHAKATTSVSAPPVPTSKVKKPRDWGL